MNQCPICKADVPVRDRASGRCPTCHAILHSVPQRTIADLREEELEEMRGLPTVVLSEDDTAARPPDEEDSADSPRTVGLGGGATVDLRTMELDVDDSMLTSHWASNLQGKESDTNATVKAKETVGGSYITKSSLIVKSRHVADRPSQTPIGSLDDAPDYELLDVIGEGGMGVVYAARQSSIARTVAVKMLKDEDSVSDDQREKFISEAVVTGELDHPNIVPIYDLGANDKGALFYSMKRVRGTPWNEVVKERSLDENLSILLRVADAVAFAHKNGVVHRDLKPENIMLGDFGEVLVMDWGLARISPDFPNADSVSQSNAMGGTPAYMAPEMASGPIDAISTASDVYLLGAILYEIVAGHPPHSGQNVMECIFHAAKNRIVPTDQSGELVEIALQAMAADPADRYESVQKFQAAVRQYQAHSESIVLTDNGASYLEVARQKGQYDLYARAVFGLEEAIELWSENHRAKRLLTEARADYAGAALANGDLDLAGSLLDDSVEQHAPLRESIEEARRQRRARQRRFQALKLAVAGLIAVVISIVSVSYVAVRNQRDRAVSAEAEARENYRQAELARKDAIAQRDRAEAEQQRAVRAEAEANNNFLAAEAARQDAVDQRDRAEQQKQIAESQRARAEREEENARQQEQLAVAAKQAEEYAAYVARIGLAYAKIEENAFDRAAELLAQCNPDLRHWEWGRLMQLCSLSEKTWQIDAPVDALAVSNDGQRFAVGDWQGRAQVYDLATGEMLYEFSHGEYVHAVAFDPSGDYLAIGSSDHQVHIHRLSDGKQVQRLPGHDDAVLSVAFSPDGQLLVSSGYDNTARIWDVEQGEMLQVLERHHWWVWDAEFSPDGRRLVTAGQDGKAVVWLRAKDDLTYRRETEFTQHRGAVYDASFSPDGLQVATAGYDGRVLLWQPEKVAPVDIERRLDGLPDPPPPFVELAAHEGPVRTVAFDASTGQLLSGGQDNVVILWDIDARAPRQKLRGHASHVRSVVFADEGATILSASRDQEVKRWRPQQYAEVRRLPASADAVLAARYSADGAQIITASRDRTAALWDASTLQRVATFDEGHEFLASRAQFFADGTRLATAAGDGSVRIWDVATGTEIYALQGVGVAGALAADDRGRYLAAGGDNNEATVWDAQTGEQLAALSGHQGEVTAAAFAPGGVLLATGDDRGVCRLWQYDAGQNRWRSAATLNGHSRTITAMQFVEEGRRLVTASGDNTCAQWDVAEGREIRDRVLKHPAWVADLAVSRDGEQVVTCCEDGKLRLWSLGDASLLATYSPSQAEALTSVDMSSDGRLAVAVSASQGTVRLWNLETGEQVAGDGQRDAQRAWLDQRQNGGLLWAARFTPEGDQVLTIGGNDARLYDLQTRDVLARFSPHGAVASADVSPDGSQAITGSWDRSAKLWDVDLGRAKLKLDGVHGGPINCVRYSPDGNLVLTASDDGTVRLWDPATGQPRGVPLEVSDGRVLDASFSPDGQSILTASDDKTARIFSIDQHAEQARFVGHDWAVLRARFSHDGQWVITGSEDNTARVWRVADQSEVARLAGHTGAVTAVGLSPDRRRAATGSVDNSVKLWDAHTGKEILTLSEHDEAVTSVSFSPDGRTILTSGRDGQTLLWPATPWQ